jgi:hypothetical protein
MWWCRTQGGLQISRFARSASLRGATWQTTLDGDALQQAGRVSDRARPSSATSVDQDEAMKVAAVRYIVTRPPARKRGPDDDEARPRWRAKLWRRIAEPDERPAHPFAKTDAF